MLATGCSASGSGDDGKTTLRITWWGNTDRTEATMKAIELFEQRHPDVDVQATPSSFGGYYNKLTTQFSSKAAPDIFQDDQVRTFSDKGLVLDLNDYRNVIDTSHIPETFLNQGTVNGHLYEIPAGASPMAFVYQPKLLQKAGVPVPTANTTWADLADSLDPLKSTLPKGTWAVADSSAQPNHFEVFLRQRGKGWFNTKGTTLGFDEKDLIAWWSYWTDLRKRGLTPPVDVSLGGSGGDVSQDPVGKGIVAAGIYGTSVTLPSDAWRYTAVPNEAKSPGVYLMRANSWAISSQTEHPTEAAELVNFLLNDPEAGALLKLARGVPSNTNLAKAARQGASAKEQDVLDYAEYLAQPGHSRPGPAPDPANTRALRGDSFTRNSQAVMLGDMSADEAARKVIAEGEALLRSAS
jgi:multiple sugar transport system substrate-binding protein